MARGRVAGKKCVVTGAGSGLGASIRQVLQEEGAHVIGFDVTVPEGRSHDIWKVDVSDESSVSNAFARVGKDFGTLDVLVNNAGIAGPRKPAHDVTVEEFDQVFAVNVRGTWLCTKHAFPLMRVGGGSIINMSSMYGLVGNTMVPLYHATKGAVRLMSKADAATYAPDGIRVNSIHPGSIDTGKQSSVRSDPAASSYNTRTLARIPLGRRGEPHDIAMAALFLASDESSYMTGSQLVVDGGYTAT